MGKMLRFEFRKLFRSKAFYICSIIVAFMSVAVVVAQVKLVGTLTGQNIELSLQELMLEGISASMLTTIAAIFTAMFVTEDFALGTIKNIYGRGYGRNLTYFAKYITITIGTLIFEIIALAGTYIYGLMICGSNTAISSRAITLILLQIVFTLIYNTLFFFFAILIGKTGGTIAVNIVLPTMIGTALEIIKYLLKLKFELADYWIGSLVDSAKNIDVKDSVLSKSTGCLIIYLVVLLAAGLVINMRKEIK